MSTLGKLVFSMRGLLSKLSDLPLMNCRRRLFAALQSLALVLTTITPGILTAETGKLILTTKSQPRRAVIQTTRDSPAGRQFSFRNTIGGLLGQQNSLGAFDPLSTTRLRLLYEDAQPLHDPDDFDLERTRRSVGKALAMRTGQVMSSLFNESELGPLYRRTLREVKSIQRLLRYSLQQSEQGLTVSTAPRGKKLLELSFNFDLKRGVDPELTIANTVRIRYDLAYQRTLLVYGFTF